MEHSTGQDARHGEKEAYLDHRGRRAKITASEDYSRYLVESEKGGKEAAHKADALSKV